MHNYFKEINAVPRPSRHEEKMREYLREFAQTRGLKLIEDNGNIIIYKDATKGMENVPMVCLQTHMDMVCVAVSIEQAYEVGTSPVVSDRYSSYSAWTADLNSSLMREAREVWKLLFGTEMKLVMVGGGMETSNFAVSYPSMQIFTFGPTVYDAHTVNEHVGISSIEHNWKYILELLKNM